MELIPISCSIVVVTKKKMRSRKAMSAIELALMRVVAILVMAFGFTY